MRKQLIRLISKPQFSESALREFADMQNSTTMLVLVQIGIVVMTYCRAVVLTYNSKPSKERFIR